MLHILLIVKLVLVKQNVVVAKIMDIFCRLLILQVLVKLVLHILLIVKLVLVKQNVVVAKIMDLFCKLLMV